jgi:hypothetical protein
MLHGMLRASENGARKNDSADLAQVEALLKDLPDVLFQSGHSFGVGVAVNDGALFSHTVLSGTITAQIAQS